MSKLSRKSFFKGIALGTVSLPFLIKGLYGNKISKAKSDSTIEYGNRDRYNWKMVTTWPPNFPVLGEVCDLIADAVYKMSNGRMSIKVYGGGELVPALEVFDAVKSGAAEMGSGASYYWAGKIQAASFFASVPFGMNAQQLNAWILCGEGQALWEEAYAPHNLVPFVAGNTGVQMGGWFNREINTIQDLKGLKMRMPGLGGKVLEKAGATPVLLAGSEIYTGLERGIIDATEWIGPYHDYKMGFHQIADYYYVNGWHEVGTSLENIVNKEKYEALPLDLQEIIRTACLMANHWVLSRFESQNSIYLKKLIEEEKVQIRYFSEDVLSEMRKRSKEVIDELTHSDPLCKKVYESYSNFQNDVANWAQVSEKQYYNDILS